MHRIIRAENLAILPSLPDGCARLIYIDPPFNTGRTQKRDRLRVTAVAEIAPEVDSMLGSRGAPKRASKTGSRTGFAGRRYATWRVKSSSYSDQFDDYIDFLTKRIEAAMHCLTADGSIFVHLDVREVHYVKVALDRVLGRDRFMNEIIWAYDYGARSRKRWPAKHDTILWYAKDPENYVFDFEAMDRLPYMAPKLVTPEKAARGKTPTDVWWHTIVPTNSKEKTGYPTQKPLGILERIVKVHSAKGDVVLDFFAGSGTTGEAAAKHGRGFVLIDENLDAARIMAQRLAAHAPECVGFKPSASARTSSARPSGRTTRASKARVSDLRR